VVDFISSEWDPRHLAETAGRIVSICGALDMIPLSRASELLANCGRYVENALGAGHTPSWQEMDLFADAVSGIDYYLERIGETSSFGVEDVLDLVARSLQGLEIPASDAAVEAEPVEAESVEAEPVEAAAEVEAPVALGEEAPVDLPGDVEAEEEEPKLEMDDDPGFDLSGTDFDDFGSARESADGSVEEDIDDLRSLDDVLAESEEAELDALADSEFEEVASEAGTPEVDVAAPVASLPPGREPVVDPSLADSFESDEEIVEIFVEEVDEVLENVDEWLPRWREVMDGGKDQEEALSEVRRSFHTLKGSGRIVGANVIGEVAWSVENMLNRLIDGTVDSGAQFISVVEQARTLVPVLKDAFEIQNPPDMSRVGQVMEMADILSSGGSLEDAAADSSANAPIELADEMAAESEEQVEQAPEEIQEAFEEELIPDLDAEEIIDEAEDASLLAEEAEEADESLLIFVGEAKGHLEVLRALVHDDGVQIDDAFVRALHTLSGSAGMADFGSIEELARPTYELASLLRGNEGRKVGTEYADYLGRAISALASSVQALEDNGPQEDHLQLIAEADHLIVAAGDTSEAGVATDKTALMALDGLGEVMGADEFLRSWKDGTMDLAYGDRLIHALTDIRDESLAQDAGPIADLAHAFAGALTRLADETLSDSLFNALCRGHDGLLNQFDALVAEQSLQPADDLVAMLDTLGYGSAYADDIEAEEREHDDGALDAAEADDDPAASIPAASIDDGEFDGPDGGPDEEAADASDNVLAFPGDSPDDEIRLDDVDDHLLGETDDLTPAGTDDVEVAPAPVSVEADPVVEVDLPPVALPAAVAELLPEDIDDEIIEVFFEEADEILEALEENIHQWSSEPDNRLYLEHMLRGLHTLKGGARLSGLTRLGDETHQFESFLIDVQSDEAVQGDGFFDDLHGRYDGITSLLTVIRKAIAGEAVNLTEMAQDNLPAPAADIELPAVEDLDAAAPAALVGGGAGDDNLPEVAEPAPQSIPAKPATATEERKTADAPEGRSSQEMVRVGSGLLEDLVNLAGESSIVRARVEQGMSDFTGALEEMETTIERLREQLRRLEIETEAQILFRQDRPEGPSHANFDPLEMDRYSQLQQLSRGLSESASDMLDLKETLLFKARESETLLLQQARINTELQEGLMRTRMVPFSRLLPRLRRIVRQVSGELGKDVEFHAYNAEGELDRSLLERMVPPLEHMLRNAVDHGIEAKELRANYGKPSTGRIDLRLSREGGDVVIEISDDGAGIDVESVRAKAVERGLMAEGAGLTDEEISQFVLAPGFSTAKSVTQISGRGVGMDVVHSEVKQLGGSIQIASRPGKGSRFIVRVPFTVSVNRALMVSVGEDFYAVPLNNIEGIVLLAPDELERLYAPDGNTFEYAGIPYRVRYLGHYLGREFRSSNQQSSVPVVLVRSGDHAVAVHVDGVQGSREIVVKSLGPQFAGVGGISGATILGDGNVVVILDLLALIRAQGGDGLIASKRPVAGAARTRCVMVVDDSVTVRKVTSRLLERQGMDVIVAKDGVEAVALLQERRPDVMLLDIEMPRMDGFEVARQVRHDERLSDLPIVMISSRTGEKHQEHAAELGVNSFLGKPFQENELLETIDRLVD
jgi:chemosensory pili system protein ChpA (sensor histidine kinase/response regulator)